MFNLVSDSTAILQYMCAIKDLKIQLKRRKNVKFYCKMAGVLRFGEKNELDELKNSFRINTFKLFKITFIRV